MDDPNETTSVRVLYIVGYGRSGSTLLDTILGSHPSIEGVGELANLPLSGWVNGEYCACGERGHLCPFWTNVRNEWIDRTGVALHSYMGLQRRFESLGSWPRLMQERRQPSPLFRTYGEQTRALFEAIRSVSGKPIIVDSSKKPARALALSLIQGIDVRFVHLIRDGRGVVWSRQKFHRRDDKAGVQRDLVPIPAWRTSVSWRLGNLLSERVIEMHRNRGVRIRYEDLIAAPVDVLDRIGDTAGVDFSLLAAGIVSGARFKPGHTIAGGRIRMAKEVRLKADLEWREHLSRRDRRVFRCLAGSLAGKYGYDRD